MSGGLAGRRALVTGGAIRVGRALSLACADLGLEVAVHFHRSGEAAERTAADCRARGVRAIAVGGDLCVPAQRAGILPAVERGLGPVDVLVNSAGNFLRAPLAEVTEEMLDRAFAVNVKAPFLLTQGVAPGMIARRFGRVVNLADAAGLEPWPSFAAHCIAKAGAVMATRVLAQTLAPHVTVNAIAPGPVLMPEGSTAEQDRRSADKTVLGRLGAPADVAEAMAYLLGAGYVTGHTLVVDGGRMVRP